MCICVFDERDYHNGIIFLDLKLALNSFATTPETLFRSIVSKLYETVREYYKTFLFCS